MIERSGAIDPCVYEIVKDGRLQPCGRWADYVHRSKPLCKEHAKFVMSCGLSVEGREAFLLAAGRSKHLADFRAEKEQRGE